MEPIETTQIEVKGDVQAYLSKCVGCLLFDSVLRVAPGSSNSINGETGEISCTTLQRSNDSTERKAIICSKIFKLATIPLQRQINEGIKYLPCQENLES